MLPDNKLSILLFIHIDVAHTLKRAVLLLLLLLLIGRRDRGQCCGCGRLALLCVGVQVPQIGRQVICVAYVVHLHIALLLHSAILEPNFDCALRQAELGGQLAPSGSRDIGLNVELFLQLVELLARERGPVAPDVFILGLVVVVGVVVFIVVFRVVVGGGGGLVVRFY